MTAVSVPCRSCRSPLTDLVLDLGPQPAADHFPAADDPAEDPRWPLELWLCGGCGLVQLGAAQVPLPEPPLAVESATSKAHAAAMTGQLLRAVALPPGARVAEVASHHGGSWLPHLLAAGLRPGSPADLVVDVHALAHGGDLDAALAAHRAGVAPGGRLVLEFHHLLPLLVEGQYDTVRHGHPVYLSLTALRPALARHGLAVLGAQRTPAYGGSLLVTAQEGGRPGRDVAAVLAAEAAAGVADPARLRALQDAAVRSRAALRGHLTAARDAGRRVLGYGAPSKAAVLLTWSGVGPELLEFTADLAPGKHGRRLPGSGVPIRSPADLLAARPDEVLVLTWDIAAEVVAQLAEVRSWGGRFVLPLPQLRVLD